MQLKCSVSAAMPPSVSCPWSCCCFRWSCRRCWSRATLASGSSASSMPGRTRPDTCCKILGRPPKKAKKSDLMPLYIKVIKALLSTVTFTRICWGSTKTRKTNQTTFLIATTTIGSPVWEKGSTPLTRPSYSREGPSVSSRTTGPPTSP